MQTPNPSSANVINTCFVRCEYVMVLVDMECHLDNVSVLFFFSELMFKCKNLLS